MKKQLLTFPTERFETLILVIRGEKVILDADLAKLYGVSTKALNQAVRRNDSRFPEDFLFSLTAKEKEEVVTNCDHLRKLKFSRTLPNAFTEHGAIMVANVLNSERAVEAGVQVVRAFVKLRNMLASNANLARKLNELEKRYDHQFKIVFDAIRQLMTPPASKPKQIGFRSRALKK
jgi:phage regulator Rha-like protein